MNRPPCDTTPPSSLLHVLPPSSVRCAKPKATGTAQKGIPGFFDSVVRAQQTADDDDLASTMMPLHAAARLRSAEAASRSTSFRTPPLKPSSFQTTAPLPQITMAPGMKGERSNRLLPSSILTHPIPLIDHPSCHPFSSSIIHPHHPTLLCFGGQGAADH